jgi:hypothetical protein
MEMTTKAVDEGFCLDFAKAFDTVGTQKRLLKKLQAHGIDGNLLNWIENWLTGREQRVVLNGEGSNWAESLSGVPQGSLLGSPLFSVFINDLDLAALLVTLPKKFADDTKLGQIIRDHRDTLNLQATLDSLMDWAAKWGMVFITKKCKVMHVGRQNQRQQYTVPWGIIHWKQVKRRETLVYR